MDPSDREILGRAFRYPYEIPRYSYLFDAGTDAAIGEADFSGRTPVLAYGSNAAPEQLSRKFGAARIPVTRARLEDHDVVYAALFAAYGAIPATIHPSPGTVAAVHVTWLTPGELARMHETEGVGTSYDFTSLPAGKVILSDAPGADEVGVYVARPGALGPEPVALASVPAENRRFRAGEERDILRLARDHLAPGTALEAFVLQTVRDPELRRSRSARLSRLTS